MKIFKIVTTTLCAITLLMVSPAFGMGKKPNKDDKPKKVFGPHLPVKKIPTEKDLQKAKELRKRTDHEEANNILYDNCVALSERIGLEHDLFPLFSKVDNLLSQHSANPNSLHLNVRERPLEERPLHAVVRNARAWQAVESLLNWKANPNALDRYQKTPLHIATQWGNNTAATLLLKAGADAQAKDEDGRTPMYYIPEFHVIALAYYKHGIVPPLLNASATTEEEEHESQNVAFKMLYALNKYPKVQGEYQAEREQIRKQVAQHLQFPTPLVKLVTDYISSDELLSTEDWSTTRAWPLVTLEPSSVPEQYTLDENKDDETEAEHQAAPTYQRDEDNPSSLRYNPKKSNNNDQ
jgi:hypothetical protein